MSYFAEYGGKCLSDGSKLNLLKYFFKDLPHPS